MNFILLYDPLITSSSPLILAQRVKIHRQHTGKHTTVGFVIFRNPEDAKTAAAAHHKHFIKTETGTRMFYAKYFD